VDSPWDNVLAEFASVVDALESAVEIQRELKVRNADRSESRRMEFRMGINLGDVVEEGSRIYGDGVNIAARIEGLAEGGGICISRMAFDNVKNKLNLGYEDLGVRYVLEGSIQKWETRMRFLIQLVDAIKGVHLWSERYDKELKDIFAMQDDVPLHVATALQVKLTEGEYGGAIARSTSKLKALECAWRDEGHYFKFSKEDNAVARQWSEKAIQLDPNFAGAWTILGWTHLRDALFPITISKRQDQWRVGNFRIPRLLLDSWHSFEISTFLAEGYPHLQA
jgi:hypothetical protein